MKVIIKNLQKKIPISPRAFLRIKKAILKTCARTRTRSSGEVTVSFVSDKAIRRLNVAYRGGDYPTDVMAFDLSDAWGYRIADIVISADTAWRNAGIYRTSVFYELCLYAVHGMLHLLGYDDRTKTKREAMHQEAIRILSSLKVTPMHKG